MIRLARIAEDCPSGTPVLVVEDNMTITATATRSDPWLLGSGHLVVMLEGRSGGYSAERVFLPPEPPQELSQ